MVSELAQHYIDEDRDEEENDRIGEELRQQEINQDELDEIALHEEFSEAELEEMRSH